MNIANIGVGVYADLNRLHSGLREGQSAVLAFAAAAASAFSTVAAAATAAGLMIDDALDGIRISTGATGEALQGLEDSFSRVFASVPNSAGDASAAVSQLSVRTGATGVALENLSTQVLTLSRITKSDLNATVTDSAKVFQSWGIAANQQSATLDMVLRASQQTGVGVGTLLQTMVTAGPVFRAAGYDFATSAALIGGFEKAGVNGQRAVASLTAAFRFFAKEGIDAQKGISQTIARIQELGPGAQASALGVKVFGRSAVDMVAAIQSGRLNVEALSGAIANGSETIAAAAQATDGFTETLATLRNRATQALEPFGTAVLAGFNQALQGVMTPSRDLLAILDLLAKAALALSVAMATKVAVSFGAATRAKIADMLASQAARVAAVQHTAAVAAQTQANLLAATAALNAARAETALTGSLVAQRAALTAVATAHAQALAATAAHTAAINAASISARLATGSMNLLRGALAFFGGPIGLAITVALTAIGWKFLEAGKKARESARMMEEAAQRAQRALESMSDTAVSQQFVGAVETTEAWREKVRQQQAITDALNARRRAGEAVVRQEQVRRGGEIDFVTVPTDFGREWEEANQRLRDYNAALEQSRIAQERAGAESFKRIQQQAQINVAPEIDIGPLAWEGSEEAQADAKRFAQSLQERVGLLTQVYDIQREGGQDTRAVLVELSGLYEAATARLRGMGDAARLAPESLQDYRDLLGIVQQLAQAGMTRVGPEQVRAVPQAVAVPAAALPAALQTAGAESGINAARFITEQSIRWRSAFADGAREAAERLKAASDNVRGMWANLLSGLPQQLRNFADMFGAIKEKQAAGGGGVAALPGALAFTLAFDALTPILEALRPAFDALMVPLAMLAEAFGPVLVSLVEAAFPVIKLLAIGLTYLAQVIGNVGGAIFKVIGEVVAAIGDLISRIPGLGQEGQAIERFGRGLVRTSSEMFELARSMPGIRDELRALEWADAMDRVADGANRAARAMVNVVEGFKAQAYAFRAARVDRSAPTPPPAAPAPPQQPNNPSGGPQRPGEQASVVYQGMTIPVQIHTTGDGRQTYRELYNELQRLARSNPAMRPFAASLSAPA